MDNLENNDCYYVIVSCALIILIVIYFLYLNKQTEQLDNFYYTTQEVCPSLDSIHEISNDILEEVSKIFSNEWNDWPEKDLYEKNGDWKIFPFYAFNIWVNDNCKKCPKTYDFLKRINGLKLATFSKLSPGMKLKPHRGWGNHSNHVIRCHYGLVVPKNCYVSVSDKTKEEIKYHSKFKWLIFDDSKTHYAENKSKYDRIVLIIDVERPKNIKTGTSDVGDSKELLDIVNYFKSKNIKANQKSFE